LNPSASPYEFDALLLLALPLLLTLQKFVAFDAFGDRNGRQQAKCKL